MSDRNTLNGAAQQLIDEDRHRDALHHPVTHKQPQWPFPSVTPKLTELPAAAKPLIAPPAKPIPDPLASDFKAVCRQAYIPHDVDDEIRRLSAETGKSGSQIIREFVLAGMQKTAPAENATPTISTKDCFKLVTEVNANANISTGKLKRVIMAAVEKMDPVLHAELQGREMSSASERTWWEPILKAARKKLNK